MPIVAAYPNAVAAFTEKFDFTDVVFAAHINALQAEVAALETILGTLPQGTAATVKARIQSLEDSITTLSGHFDSSGMIPQTGVTGLVTALAGKSATGHHHVDADITDLSGAYVYHAINADSATNAGHATNADNATSATNAGHASNADAAPWGGLSGVPSLVNSVNGRAGAVSLSKDDIGLHSGQASLGATDGNGKVNFVHGMGSCSAFVVTPWANNTNVNVLVAAHPDGNTVTLQFYHADNAAPWTGTGFTIEWIGMP